MNAIAIFCGILAVSQIVNGNIGFDESQIIRTEDSLIGDVPDASGSTAFDGCSQANVDSSCRVAESDTINEIKNENLFSRVGIDIPFSLGRGPSHFHASFSRSSKLDAATRFQGRRFELAAGRLCDNLQLPKNRSPRRSFLARIKRFGGFRIPLPCKFSKYIDCSANNIFRTADGRCNNLRFPTSGQAGTAFSRFIAPVYDNGIGTPRRQSVTGKPLPSPRNISIEVHPDSDLSTESQNLTHMVMQWSQWMDHDLDLTPMLFGEDGSEMNCCENRPINKDELQKDDPTEEEIQELVNRREGCFPIRFPKDPVFQTTCINFIRSLAATPRGCRLSWREQTNGITSYIDSSNIYGSSLETQRSLRQLSGGLLKVQANPGRGGDLLPANEEAIDRAACNINPERPDELCFRAGDVRSNEFVGLAAIHTMWVREHNYVAGKLSEANSHWEDERIFQETRRIIVAFNQHITYNEWLPIILGPDLVQRWGLLPLTSGSFNGYNKYTRADIRNSFATAAFRMGHSYINSELSQVDKNFQLFGTSSVLVTGDNFFQPGPIFDDSTDGPDSILRGLTVDKVQAFDRFITSEVTERLFVGRFSGQSLDLAALNIQRGRDHGLPGYLAFRRLCRLSYSFTDFNELPDHDVAAQAALRRSYANVADIDLFSGGLSERPLSGSLIGPTFGCIIAAQFRLLKQGDRFYYENNIKNYNNAQGFAADELREIRKVTLAHILCNSTDTDTMQRRAFVTSDTAGNGRVHCDQIVQPDISVFNSDKARTPYSPSYYYSYYG